MTRSLRITMGAVFAPAVAASLLIAAIEGIRHIWRLPPSAGSWVAAAVPIVAQAVLACLAYRTLRRRLSPMEMRLAKYEKEHSILLGIAENAKDGILSFDPSGRLLYSNEAARRLLGIEGDSASCSFFDRLTAESLERLLAGMKEARETGSSEREVEFRTSRTGGEPAFANLSLAVRLPKPDHPVSYYSGILRDTTEQKRIEREYERALRKEEQSNRDKSRFLARISHDIRTPLNAIINTANLIDRSELTDEQRDGLEQIDISSRHLLRTLNNFLDYSKLEAEKMVLENAPFRLRRSMRHVMHTMAALLGDKPVELKLNVDSDVPDHLVGDSHKLEQVLYNLAGNAVKFTERGEVELIVEMAENKPDGPCIHFAVRDTGIGMTRLQLERLFQPYHQASASISRHYGGSGLGLVIAKGLIELMDGTLEAESKPGAGTVFRFVVPFRTAPPAAAEFSPLPCRVLVVGPSGDNPPSWFQELSRLCEAIAFGSWEDALAEAERHSAAGLIVDMEADRMSGYGHWSVWKRECDRRGIPVAAACGFHGRQAINRLPESLRPAAVVLKTADASAWHRALRKLLEAGPPAGSDCFAPSPKAKVLLVEDHEISRKVAARMLQSLGAEVVASASGPEALGMLESDEPFGLVLMDLHMPVMDGIAAVRNIRSLPRRMNLPIVMLTADTTKEQHERCYEAGAQEVITKPVEMKRLRDLLERWLPDYAAAENGCAPVPVPELEGLDVALALGRLGGNPRLYVHLLDRLKEKYAGAGAELKRLSEQGDFREAKRMLHSLRGAASHLAAGGVYEIATRLESAFGESPPEGLNSLIGELDDEFRAVFRSIDKYKQSISLTNKSDTGGDSL
ncbi:response regulator [Cohnella xylanilytica]|uniref:Circadian input-output histidine kinase CikA n=1 Tax=Cohnella xylanilytica TaxID=557555 RepID=A0A841TZH4_9BACL|nr:response regulator [Cohnella xylanilytica]MBB6693635.1 response regulator [Cohnella xylanilytica]